MSPELYKKWIDLEPSESLLVRARSRFPCDADIMLSLLEHSDAKIEPQDIYHFIQVCSPQETLGPVLQKWLSIVHRSSPASLLATFFDLMDRLAGIETPRPIILDILKYIVDTVEIEEVPALYDRFMSGKAVILLHPVSDACLVFIYRLLSTPASVPWRLSLARKAFEKALLSSPSSRLIWRLYIQLETDHGDMDRAGHLHWRARKEVPDI
jgi:hypothetical protein